jgi:eukaryotic-like serine/threonine-protein kinase
LQRIGPFEVIGVLGSGGMGMVYRAVGPDRRPAAIKVLIGGLSSVAVARFQREAALRLDHPNIVHILGADIENSTPPYIAFELVEGESLRARLARGPIPEPEVVSLAVQACRALAYAHASGVVHRDLKPGNMLLTRSGDLKLLDFGIASLRDAPTRLTKAGTVMGTPPYLSPEQARGELDIDGRADVWGLGAVLYHALAGAAPFLERTPLATIFSVLVHPLEPLAVRAPHVSPAFASIVERALQKLPEDRWPSMDAMHSALLELDTRDRAIVIPARPRAQSIRSAEQRVVAVLLAHGVRDPAAARQAIDESGGRALPLAGGSMLALFGLDAWVGDEVFRAARAGRAMASIVECAAVTIGRGAKLRGTFAGDALDAAEECAASGEQGLIANTDAARALAEAFEVRELSAGVYRVIAERSHGGLGRPIAAELVGRDAELALARRALRSAIEDRRPVAISISGAAGIGKGHLARQIANEFREAVGSQGTLLTANARPEQLGSAFSFFAALVRSQLADAFDGSSLEQRQHAVHRLCAASLSDSARALDCAAFLGEMLGISMPESPTLGAARSDPTLMRDQLRRTLRDHCVGLLERGAVGIFAGDLQWADAESLQVLVELFDFAAESLLLVMTARPGVDMRFFLGRDVVSIDLRGVGSSDVAQIAERVCGRRISPELARALFDRTGGNPLFVEQIVGVLADERKLDDPPEQLPLPITVEAAVQSRLDQLPPVEREVVKSASILSRAFGASELAALGTKDAAPHLDSLAHKGLLSPKRGPELQFRFRSALVADVASRMIGGSRKRELHRLAATHLAKIPEFDPEELARHWEEGGVPDRAAALYEMAAFEERGGSQRALRCAEKVIALGPSRASCELHLVRAEALQFLGRHQDQFGMLMTALESARTELLRGRVQNELIKWFSRSGDFARALEASESAVEAGLAAHSPEVLALALGRRAMALAGSGRLSEAQSDLERAIRYADQCPIAIRGSVADWRGRIATALGELDGRREAFAAARDLFNEAGDVRRAAGADVNLADAFNRLGSYEAAREALLRALAGCRAVGNRTMEAYALLNLGYSLSMLGRTEESLEMIANARRIGRPMGEPRLALLIAVYEGRALAFAGRHTEELAETLERVAKEASALGLTGVDVSAFSVASSVHHRLGARDRALAMAECAMAVVERVGAVEEDEAEAFAAYGRALAANHREDEAKMVFERGRQRVFAIAHRIKDEALRRTFLEGVPAHRELFQV